MRNTEISQQDAFEQLIDNYIEDHYCMELLRFFGSHPRTRFNRLAVTLNGNGQRSEAESALAQLIEKGVVKTSIENNVPLYSLTEDKSIRRRVLELINLEWCHRQLALSTAHPVPVERNSRQQ
jgi:hypothetical protein